MKIRLMHAKPFETISLGPPPHREEYIPPGNDFFRPTHHHTRHGEYIPPERPSEEFTVPPEVMYDEPPVDTFKERRKARKTEDELLKKAKTAYDIAHGDSMFLFIQTRDGKWHNIQEFTAQQMHDLGYEAERQAQNLIMDPQYVQYKFTPDKHFDKRQALRSQREEKREKRFDTVKRDISKAFDYRSEAERRRAEQIRKQEALGPDTSALFKASRVMGLSGSHHGIPPSGDTGDFYSPKPPLASLPDLRRSPDYQEVSPLGPAVVPYRPVGYYYVSGAPKKPLFKPPFLGRI